MISKKYAVAFLSVLMLSGCYVKRVEKTTVPAKETVIERPHTDVTVTEESHPRHETTTVTHY